MTLGSRKNANQIFEFFHHSRDEELPKGWEFVGAGITRSAYLGPDGICYKVAHFWPHWNINEAKQMKRLRHDPELQRLEVTTPRTTLWKTGVLNEVQHYTLAMDYIEKTAEVECAYDFCDETPNPCNCRTYGEPRICFGLLLERLFDHGIEDVFPENIHFAADGKFYLIDLGQQ